MSGVRVIPREGVAVFLIETPLGGVIEAHKDGRLVASKRLDAGALERLAAKAAAVAKRMRVEEGKGAR